MIELPLVVSMTVDHSVNEYDLSVENNQNTIPLNNTVVISVEQTVPEYEGDYVVTASTDGAITLMTEGKKCVDNITVNKLQKQTILNPTISIDANTGLATALTTYQIGYNDVTTITSKTYQMPILHPRIITPSEYEQTVATKGDYAVGTIKVAPIKNVQIASGVGRVNANTYTAVSGQTLTVAKTGKYDVYWCGYRSSTSGTSGSQLYIGDSAYGSANTTFDSTYTNCQNVHLSDVSLAKDDIIVVRARSRSSSYYMYIYNLTIIEV